MAWHAPTLIIAAMTVEVGPLVRGLGLRRLSDRPMPTWSDAAGTVVATVTGLGPRRAAQRAATAIDTHRPANVIITGFAGSLSPMLGPGDLIIPATLIDTGTDRVHSPGLALPNMDCAGKLVTVDQVAASVEQKRTIARAHGADAIDMESSSIAAMCEGRGSGWLCVRAISDAADQAVPAGLAELVRDNGDPDAAAAARWAVRHPTQVPAMLRLKADCDRAAAALARALDRDTLASLR
jgi:nucleoside phosphorylase